MEYQEQVKTYFKQNFLYDLKAGFITAVVALPLALAFAIASGVPPVMGLYTAVVAGILGSLFGGSIFSVTGPTGAMVVLILSTVTKFGLEGLLLAGFFAGIFQIGFGLLKVGKVVKYLPLPLVSGFTAGIGAIISCFLVFLKNLSFCFQKIFRPFKVSTLRNFLFAKKK